MAGRAKLGLVVVVLGAVVGITAEGSLAGDHRSPTARASGFTSVIVDVMGYVMAPRGRGAAVVEVSAHGLTPNTTYEASGSRRPCSAAAAGPVVWRIRGATQANDDGVVAGRVRTNASLRRIRSIRLYEVAANGQMTQRRCERLTGSGPRRFTTVPDLTP